MAAYTFEGIIKDLKNKIYHPVYFFHGEEPYFIDKLAEYIEDNVLTVDEKEFNQTVLYGRDIDPVALFSTAKRYPMMANYQVVIIREAQDVKNLFKRKSANSEESKGSGNDTTDNDPFFNYLSNPQKSTILVFCYKYKKADKRTKAGKLLEKAGVVYESKKLYEDKLKSWIITYVKANGFVIGERAAILLAEYLGTDLSKLSNELDKLMIILKKGAEIDTSVIENNIGISKDFNVFELQEAISKRDYKKATRIVNYFRANPKSNPLVLTLSTLNGYYNKIISYHFYKGKPGINMAAALGVHSYFLRDYELAARSYTINDAVNAIGLLHEFDLRSKGVNNLSATENDLLRELVYKLIHPGILVE